MPSNSTNRLLIAPIRAARISRRPLYLVSCQEPIRRPPKPNGLNGPPGLSGPLG